MDEVTERKAYKLLTRNRDDALVSYCAPKGYEVHYRPGQWVHPLLHCGPLATFATLEDVTDFSMVLRWARRSETFAFFHNMWPPWLTTSSLWECTVRVSGEDRLWVPDQIAYPTGHYIKMFTNLPAGTLLADAVRLDREVPWEEFYNHITAKETQNERE